MLTPLPFHVQVVGSADVIVATGAVHGART